MSEPPWKYLDPGIVPLVRLLHQAGVKTLSSCQGGNHSPWSTTLPWVSCDAERGLARTASRVSRAMLLAGWTGFTVEAVTRDHYELDSREHERRVVVTVGTLEGQPE